MSDLICPKCNYRTKKDESFCCKCGAKLTAQKTFCKHCGTEIKPDEQFCTKCGTMRNKQKPYTRKKSSWGSVVICLILLLISLFLGRGSGCLYKEKVLRDNEIKKMRESRPRNYQPLPRPIRLNRNDQ